MSESESAPRSFAVGGVPQHLSSCICWKIFARKSAIAATSSGAVQRPDYGTHCSIGVVRAVQFHGHHYSGASLHAAPSFRDSTSLPAYIGNISGLDVRTLVHPSAFFHLLSTRHGTYQHTTLIRDRNPVSCCCRRRPQPVSPRLVAFERQWFHRDSSSRPFSSSSGPLRRWYHN